MTTSIPAASIIAGASSVTKVPPLFTASATPHAAYCSRAQPTRASASHARSGARSATAATWNPGVRGAWARNIEPNLPAPMRPMRTGFPASARARSFAVRFTAVSLSDRLTLPGVLHETVVGQHVDRREVAIGDPGGALEAANGVVAAIEREIDDPARPRRKIGARGMHEIAVEQQRRVLRALGGDDASLLHQPGDGVVVDGPERVARRRHVVPRLEPAFAVASRDEHQPPVALVVVGA